VTALVAVNYSAPISSAAGSIAIGQCLVSSGTAGYVVATSANRTTYGRPDGISFTTGDQRNPVTMIVVGPVPATVTGLGSGVAGPIRVSSAGALERVATPSSSDEVVGYCETDGSAHVAFGVLTHRVYVDSGGGGGTPGGSDHDLQVNDGGSFAGLSPGTSGNLCVSDGTDWTSAAPSFAASVIASGTLVHERGGLEADVSAYSGLVKIAAGSTSAVTLDSAVETWIGTPSGANLASALTTALPASKGGTGLTSLGSGVATWLGTPSGANLASALSSALTAAKGGTGIDTSASTGVPKIAAGTWSTFALGTGVETFLTTPSGANLASALTSALPVSKGGTNQTALGSALQVLRTNAGATDTEWATVSATPAGSSGDIQTNNAGSFGSLTPGTGVSTWLATPSGANLASALTTALPDSKGGTGLTALGSGVATMLGTFSSANIKSACTDETGTGGALVFATSPTLTTPQIDGGRVEANTFRLSGVFTISGTTGGDNIAHGGARIIRLTNATPPSITGVSASGVEDGEMLIIINAGGVTTLVNDATSTAANRLLFVTGADVAFATNAIAIFFYDATTQRWRCVCANAI